MPLAVVPAQAVQCGLTQILSGQGEAGGELQALCMHGGDTVRSQGSTPFPYDGWPSSWLSWNLPPASGMTPAWMAALHMDESEV